MRHLILTMALSIAFVGSAEAGNKKHKQKLAPAPVFSTKSFLVADSSGNILKEMDSESVRPIASISKLMIGLLAAEQDLFEELNITRSGKLRTHIPLKVTTLTRKELLTLALVKSDNLAAQILCDNLADCVSKMNGRAADIGMTNTHFVEPTGLSDENVSTANDLLKLAIVAAANTTVSSISSLPDAAIDTSFKPIEVNNTNPLTSKLDVILSKTGTTNAAGGCLVMVMNSAVGQRILILLGSRSGKTRIPDMERLVKDL